MARINVDELSDEVLIKYCPYGFCIHVSKGLGVDKAIEKYEELKKLYGLPRDRYVFSYNPIENYDNEDPMRLVVHLAERPKGDYKEHLVKKIREHNAKIDALFKKTKKSQDDLENHPLLSIDSLKRFRFYLYSFSVNSADGDRHSINFHQLINCYGLPRDRCVNGDRLIDNKRGRSHTPDPYDIHLYPCEAGNYRENLLNWIETKLSEIHNEEKV